MKNLLTGLVVGLTLGATATAFAGARDISTRSSEAVTLAEVFKVGAATDAQIQRALYLILSRP